MASPLDLILKLDAETRVVQWRLLAYVQEQLSTKTRVHAAEMVEKEEGWGPERDMLYGRIADLEAENARFKGAGGLERGKKCCQCVKHRKTISGLERDLRKSGERPTEEKEGRKKEGRGDSGGGC